MAKKELNLKEHEPEILTTHGIFRQSQLKHYEVIDGAEKSEKGGLRCPIARRDCFSLCALNDGGACCIETGAEIHADGVCPFNPSNHCGERCALYKNKNCLLIPKQKAR